MSNQNNYDDLLQREEELFNEFLKKRGSSLSTLDTPSSESTPAEPISEKKTKKTTSAIRKRTTTKPRTPRPKKPVIAYQEPVQPVNEKLQEPVQPADSDIGYNNNGEPSDAIHSIRDMLPDLSLLSTPEAQNLSKWQKVKLFFSLITRKDNVRKLSCLVLPAFLVLFLFINIVVPAEEMSEKENRALAQMPEITSESVLSGRFMKDFESYISDQFVFRNAFVSAKRNYELLSGKEENHGILICDDGYLIENTSNLTRNNLASNIEGINALSAVSRYKVKVAIVPTAYEVMKSKLPDNAYVNAYGELQKTLINNAKNVNITDTNTLLSANSDKYLYYRTDHHQTALGSYYVYESLAADLGFEPYPLESFDVEKVSSSFCGTAWSNSGFADTKNDSIYKYTLRDGFKYKVSFPAENKKMDTLYNEKMLKTKDKYSYYLDGNHALTVVSSDCNTGKKLAIIKDSYAHSVVPFLANHYNTIYMIDLRYYNGDIFEYLYTNNINDVVVLYNQNTFMTDTNLSKITEFSKVSSFTKVPEVTYGVVPEMEPVDISYFDNAVFVGDSLTIGIQNFSGFNSEFLCITGLNTLNINSLTLPSGKTAMQTIYDYDSEDIAKLYIMLGTNELANNNMESFLERYTNIIDDVQKRFPDVIIYIESIMPVSEARASRGDITNEKIMEYNEELLKLAVEKQCYYVDLHSHFTNENNAMPSDITTDGIHPTADNYKKLSSLLQNHAVPEKGVVKLEQSSKSTFAGGGKSDTTAIGDAILGAVKFEDTLAKVSDTIAVSTYKVDPEKICSASLYLGGGSTAEEIAVFEAINESEAEKLEKLAKERIEQKKKDFENYIPEEMPKLNSPTIIRKGCVVVVCIADNVDEAQIRKIIK